MLEVDCTGGSQRGLVMREEDWSRRFGRVRARARKTLGWTRAGLAVGLGGSGICCMSICGRYTVGWACEAEVARHGFDWSTHVASTMRRHSRLTLLLPRAVDLLRGHTTCGFSRFPRVSTSKHVTTCKHDSPAPSLTYKTPPRHSTTTPTSTPRLHEVRRCEPSLTHQQLHSPNWESRMS